MCIFPIWFESKFDGCQLGVPGFNIVPGNAHCAVSYSDVYTYRSKAWLSSRKRGWYWILVAWQLKWLKQQFVIWQVLLLLLEWRLGLHVLHYMSGPIVCHLMFQTSKLLPLKSSRYIKASQHPLFSNNILFKKNQHKTAKMWKCSLNQQKSKTVLSNFSILWILGLSYFEALSVYMLI